MSKKNVTILGSREKLVDVPKSLENLSESEMERKRCISRVMTYVLKHLTLDFVNRGFEWLLPVIFSKSTDPLWPDPGASLYKRIEVEIYGDTVRTTLSMIVHKMIASSLAHPKLFTLSPNVRLERRERATTGMHAYEFTQLDFEVRYGSSKNIRSLVEEILRELVDDIRRDMKEDLQYLERYETVSIPRNPFMVYDGEDLENKYGKGWETKILSEIEDPIWIINVPREFYDFEDLEEHRWDNYDLLLPGYGEVLSGALREWEYDKMVKKMERDGVKRENFRVLLKLASEGRIKPSAGAGIGLERLVSWIVGASHIGETQLFPKIPGIVYDL